MLEGIFTEKVLNHETIRAYPPQPQDTSGYYIGTQSVYLL